MGIRHTLGQTAGDLVTMLRTRLELFSVEFSLEKSRLLKLMGLVAVALIFLLLAAIVGSFLVIAYFWDTPHRMLCIGLLTAAYGLAGILLLAMVCRKLQTDDAPFQATTQELQRDAALLTSLGKGDEKVDRS